MGLGIRGATNEQHSSDAVCLIITQQPMIVSTTAHPIRYLKPRSTSVPTQVYSQQELERILFLFFPPVICVVQIGRCV
uniref:Uncharacterized protein n=1 Tax=Ascaris lumbricoides TaxID=6252 RepID=A0A0M3I5Z6_ASCLU